MGRPEELNQAFAELAETLVGAFDLAETLERVLGCCVDACGAAGAGIVIEDGHGKLRDIAYSDDRVRRLERLQVQINEGPCVDCVRLGHPVVAVDLIGARDRWPRFAEAAAESGYLAVRAMPLRFYGRTVGALNIFGHDGAECAEERLPTAQAFADLAMVAIIQHSHAEESPALHITQALAARSAIEQAKGMLAEDGGLTVAQALTALRAHAARTGQGITRLARAVVRGDVGTEDVLVTRPTEPR
ncbi:GAF and ANTAR domain-containing protein [Streptacidiphilus rugosus]|uniref:GAF and ANTAR domain-containing protein n=1 Tax=Streptacidiphilus rugosus TaxID=405783 RepID=UPI00056A3304|nr:GAF and ANTAR domain-containing protein [Streptacidiphilus rugosus]